MSQTRVFLPRSAANQARAAAMVVLPTPPLPVTKTSLRSRRSATHRRAEPDPALVAGRVELDVSDPRRRHPDLATLAVGQPQDAAVAADGLLHLGRELIGV